MVWFIVAFACRCSAEGALAFFLADVVDLPAVLRVGLEPVVWQQIGQVRWLSRIAGGGEPDGQFPKDSIQPGPGFDFAEFGAGDNAQQDGRPGASGFTANEQEVFASNGREFHQAFCQIVVNRQSSVLRVAA